MEGGFMDGVLLPDERRGDLTAVARPHNARQNQVDLQTSVTLHSRLLLELSESFKSRHTKSKSTRLSMGSAPKGGVLLLNSCQIDKMVFKG
jgi:hypothetical protein